MKAQGLLTPSIIDGNLLDKLSKADRSDLATRVNDLSDSEVERLSLIISKNINSLEAKEGIDIKLLKTIEDKKSAIIQVGEQGENLSQIVEILKQQLAHDEKRLSLRQGNMVERGQAEIMEDIVKFVPANKTTATMSSNLSQGIKLFTDKAIEISGAVSDARRSVVERASRLANNVTAQVVTSQLSVPPTTLSNSSAEERRLEEQKLEEIRIEELLKQSRNTPKPEIFKGTTTTTTTTGVRSRIISSGRQSLAPKSDLSKKPGESEFDYAARVLKEQQSSAIDQPTSPVKATCPLTPVFVQPAVSENVDSMNEYSVSIISCISGNSNIKNIKEAIEGVNSSFKDKNLDPNLIREVKKSAKEALKEKINDAITKETYPRSYTIRRYLSYKMESREIDAAFKDILPPKKTYSKFIYDSVTIGVPQTISAAIRGITGQKTR